MFEGLKIRGDWLIEARDHATGQVLEREEKKNLILNVGKERVAKLLNGVSVAPFSFLAIGEGSTAATTADTELETEVDRAEADSSGGTYEADYKAVLEKTFTFGSSYSITEAACVDSDTVSASTLLNRVVFAAKAVGTTTDLYLKVTITVS